MQNNQQCFKKVLIKTHFTRSIQAGRKTTKGQKQQNAIADILDSVFLARHVIVACIYFSKCNFTSVILN